jgi:hypothetical protein
MAGKDANASIGGGWAAASEQRQSSNELTAANTGFMVRFL